MEKELENIVFKYSFRDYQKETLQMLEKYMNDKKLHIVAAPGAGKTILALELLLRLGKKALILTPTIAIKEQWIERLKKDFTNGDKVGLISDNLENPSTITVITYQYLYSLNRKRVNLEQILKQNNIKTIILDEAHHLRNAWQKTLKVLMDKLEGTTTISLTATPPYDDGNDFSNYMELCGDIDAKITIPQLVKSNCLCPHQDYIYFNTLTLKQENEIAQFSKSVNILIEKILNNKQFIKAIALNEYIINPQDNVTNILKDFDFYVAMLSFLKKTKCIIPVDNINKNIEIPAFNIKFMEIILEKYIYGKGILEQEIFKEVFEEIKQELRKLECIDEDNNINLKYSKKISDMLIKNAGKLNSINEIIKIEKESLKEKLKLVVITDFIKEEYYDVESIEQINEIGVMPIFRKLIHNNNDEDIAVLTGSLVIIPTKLKEQLYEIAKKEFNIEKDNIKVTELGIDFNYSEVIVEAKYSRYLVNLITKLFEQSSISVLVGTIALIGEGWDAPFVNSLIMATIVSSYVTSNQVRGRTIRINKQDSKKVANIWHLVCVENEKDKCILGHDYEILSKRFFAFEGIYLDNNKIETGIERTELKNKEYDKLQIEAINNKMIAKAKNRKNVASSWKKALENYIPICIDKIPQKKIYTNKKDKLIRKYNGKIVNFFKVLWVMIKYSWLLFILFLLLPALGWEPVSLSIGAVACVFLYAYKVKKSIGKTSFSVSYEKFIKKICEATHKSLIEIGKLDSKSQCFITIKNNEIEYGLKNASTYEQMIYLKSIKQALNLNENSRYIIKSLRNVCSVPELLEKNKNDAMIFFNNIKLSGKKLIYTKTEDGRKVLLESKLQELNRNL